MFDIIMSAFICLLPFCLPAYILLSAKNDAKEYKRLIELQKGKTLRIPYALKDEEVNVYGSLNMTKKGSINGLDSIVGTIVYSMDNVASNDKSNCSETFTIVEHLSKGRDVIKIRFSDGLEGYIYASKINRFAEVKSLGTTMVCAVNLGLKSIKQLKNNDILSGLSFPVSVKSAIQN